MCVIVNTKGQPIIQYILITCFKSPDKIFCRFSDPSLIFKIVHRDILATLA